MFNPFFEEIPLSKQYSRRWDAAVCGVTSGVYYTWTYFPDSFMNGFALSFGVVHFHFRDILNV